MEGIKKSRKRTIKAKHLDFQNKASLADADTVTPTVLEVDTGNVVVDASIGSPTQVSDIATTTESSSKQQTASQLFQNWTSFASSTALNCTTPTTRSFQLAHPSKSNMSKKLLVRSFHIHEIEKGSDHPIKPVMIMRGRVRESAFDDRSVLDKLDYNGDPCNIHHYSIEVQDETGGDGLVSSAAQISADMVASPYASTLAKAVGKEKLEEGDINHSYNIRNSVYMKAYVGTWRADAIQNPTPLDSHIPNSAIPISRGQTYAPTIFCCDADGGLLEASDAFASVDGKLVDVYFKFEFAVGWSKKLLRKFVYINAKPLGVRLLSDGDQGDQSSPAAGSPVPLYEGAFI